jgi:membrane associated rhomboid family serine protease
MRAPSRDPTPPWFRPIQDRLSPTITTLVVVNAVLYALYAVVPRAQVFIKMHLALGPGATMGQPVPELWQVVTSLFVHLDPLSFFFNVLGLWFVGATIERQMGRQRFLILFLVPAVLANLVMAGLMRVFQQLELFAGSGLAVLALFVAFGRTYDRTPARVLGGLVMEARTLTLILVAFAVVADLLRGSMIAVAGDIVALVASYLLAGGRGAGLRELFTKFGRRSTRRRFSVVDGGRPGSKEERRSGYLN